MRSIGSACLGALLLSGVGCGWLLDPEERCISEESFPRCSADGRLAVECWDGIPVEHECDFDEACLEYREPDGSRGAQCLPPDATPCDPAEFVPRCRDGGGLWLCDLGYTRFLACLDGDECLETPLGPACLEAGSEPCDPDTFVPECRGDRRATCSSYSATVRLEEPCLAPAICRVGTRGPVCAPAEAEPCDPTDFDEVCRDEGTELTCDFGTHFTEARPCPQGERCRANSWSAACFGPDQPDCDPAAFTTTCEGPDRRTCSSFGVEEVSPCPAEQPCRVGGAGAWCVEPGAAPCDPAAFAPACEGQDMVLCNQVTGFSYRTACAEGLVCVPDANPWTWVGLVCVDPASPACAPAGDWHCEGALAVFCSGGYRQEQACEEGSVCVADTEMWLCLPDTYPPCDQETFVDRCEDNAVHFCFGTPGREVIWECGDAATCAIVPDGPTCQPI